MHKITPEEYAYFRSRVVEHARELGLPYEFHFDLKKINEHRAVNYIDIYAKISSIQLNSEWMDYKPTLEELDRVAYHEAVEVLLYPLRKMAVEYVNVNIVDAEIHAVIGALENYKFGYTYGTSMTVATEDDREKEEKII